MGFNFADWLHDTLGIGPGATSGSPNQMTNAQILASPQIQASLATSPTVQAVNTLTGTNQPQLDKSQRENSIAYGNLYDEFLKQFLDLIRGQIPTLSDPNSTVNLWNTTAHNYLTEGDAFSDRATDALNTPAYAGIAGTPGVGQDYLTAKADLDRYGIQPANIDWTQEQRDAQANAARQVAANTRSGMRTTGASMASRGLGGSGAYTTAMADQIAGGNRSLADQNTGIQTLYSGRMADQRTQNMNFANNMAGHYNTLNNNFAGHGYNAWSAGNDMARQRATNFQNQANNRYNLAGTASNAATQNQFSALDNMGRWFQNVFNLGGNQSGGQANG